MPKAGWNEAVLADIFRIVSDSCWPRSKPDAEYWHHSLPSFDLCGGPTLERGEQIESNKTVITQPVVLVSKLNPRIPRVSLVENLDQVVPHCASTEFIAYTPRVKCSLRFFRWFFGSEPWTRRLMAAATGTTNSHTRVTPRETLTWKIIIPSPPEQETIAESLDVLDDAIQKTLAVLAKLREIKLGLLHDLLTRGIDEHGRLRDPARHPEQFQETPIGLLPRRWTAAPLGEQLTDIEAGHSPSCPSIPAAPGEWGVLKVSAVNHLGFVPEENKQIVNWCDVDESCEVRVGDLLMTRCNTPELVGAACIVEETPARLMLCDKTLRLSVNPERDEPRFLVHVLRMPSVRRQIEISATGSSGSMKNISQSDIRAYLVPRPLADEQRRIAQRIDTLFSQIAAEQCYLAKLRAIKSGLAQDLLAAEST
jgi:type I restriction enzyme, S subunit